MKFLLPAFLLLVFCLSVKPILAQTVVPTGSLYTCVLTDFQRPSLTDSCADCLYQNRPDIRQLYNWSNHTACTNVQIYNHWCNGGLQFADVQTCNGVKNGICSQLPAQACIALTPIPGFPTLTPTPPATVNTVANPRGCGILYTSGIPSCWCNNGGGQGLCGNLPLDGPGGCRDLCERGTFVGPRGYTHCFMMEGNAECASNPDGSYRLCTKRCLPGSPGYSQNIGCEYPNKTVFSQAKFDTACILAFNKSSNLSFSQIIESFYKGLTKLVDIITFRSNAVRVPGLQNVGCNPAQENCTFE